MRRWVNKDEVIKRLLFAEPTVIYRLIRATSLSNVRKIKDFFAVVSTRLYDNVVPCCSHAFCTET